MMVDLPDGDYIVSVHHAHPPRVWKHQGLGLFEGHGGKIRRGVVQEVINYLNLRAEEFEANHVSGVPGEDSAGAGQTDAGSNPRAERPLGPAEPENGQ